VRAIAGAVTAPMPTSTKAAPPAPAKRDTTRKRGG
jgi:hypothetical protein